MICGSLEICQQLAVAMEITQTQFRAQVANDFLSAVSNRNTDPSATTWTRIDGTFEELMTKIYSILVMECGEGFSYQECNALTLIRDYNKVAFQVTYAPALNAIHVLDQFMSQDTNPAPTVVTVLSPTLMPSMSLTLDFSGIVCGQRGADPCTPTQGWISATATP